MGTQDPKLREIWLQKQIPVVYREGKSKPILLRLPYSPDNREWLQGDHRRRPEWNTRYNCWETPKAWFDEIIRLALKRFGRVYVIQPFKAQ